MPSVNKGCENFQCKVLEVANCTNNGLFMDVKIFLRWKLWAPIAIGVKCALEFFNPAAIFCLKLTMKTQEQGVKYVQS